MSAAPLMAAARVAVGVTSLTCLLPTSREPPLTTRGEPSQSSSLGDGSCPKPVAPRCLPEYLRRVGRGKGTFRAAARANLTRRSTDDGRPKVAPSSYRLGTLMPLSAVVNTVARCPCAAR
jgi:hypothetical protein